MDDDETTAELVPRTRVRAPDIPAWLRADVPDDTTWFPSIQARYAVVAKPVRIVLLRLLWLTAYWYRPLTLVVAVVVLAVLWTKGLPT